jgi:formylglycine-generating enzyme required for sulfatase activity
VIAALALKLPPCMVGAADDELFGGMDEEYVFFKDDRPTTYSMIYIPGGQYTLGLSDEEIYLYYETIGHPISEKMLHGRSILASDNIREITRKRELVEIKPFYILDHELRHAAYKQFIDATGYPRPRMKGAMIGFLEFRQLNCWTDRGYPPGRSIFPIMSVAGLEPEDAEAFCKWRSEKTGVLHRLPTEDEREAAYRGKKGYLFPWGNDWECWKGGFGLERHYLDGPMFFPFEGAGEVDTTSEGLGHMLGNLYELTTATHPRPAYKWRGQQYYVWRGLSYTASLKDGPPCSIRDNSSPAYDDIQGFRYVIPVRDGKLQPYEPE